MSASLESVPELGDLLRAWDYPRGLWEPSCSANPDPPDNTLTKEGLVEIFDAEGNTICYAPLGGPEGQKDWPATLAKLLNAMTDAARYP